MGREDVEGKTVRDWLIADEASALTSHCQGSLSQLEGPASPSGVSLSSRATYCLILTLL